MQQMHIALSRFLHANDMDKSVLAYARSAPLPLQLLAEPLPWNWGSPSTGSTPPQAYNFFDFMPVSSNDADPYVPSSNSFSAGYRTFLTLIDRDHYPDPQVIDSALQANPSSSTYSPPLPPGWTRVTDETQISSAKPGWSIPLYPPDWISAVSSSRLSLDLLGSELKLSSQVVPVDQIQKLNFSADHWGRIPITPSTWYNGSIVSYVRAMAGPYKNIGINNMKIFGAGGIIPCRVAQFTVALNPRVDVEVVSNVLNRNDLIDSLSVGGFRFGDADDDTSSVRARISVEAASQSTARITASPLGGNQPFIMSVEIESMLPNSD
jgi:hypothetical protein